MRTKNAASPAGTALINSKGARDILEAKPLPKAVSPSLALFSTMNKKAKLQKPSAYSNNHIATTND